MVPFFDVVSHGLREIHQITELLEACDWDESIMNSRIEKFQDVLEVLPTDEVVQMGLDVWVYKVLEPVLELNGFTKHQATIMSKVILIKRDEIYQALSLGEQ